MPRGPNISGHVLLHGGVPSASAGGWVRPSSKRKHKTPSTPPPAYDEPYDSYDENPYDQPSQGPISMPISRTPASHSRVSALQAESRADEAVTHKFGYTKASRQDDEDEFRASKASKGGSHVSGSHHVSGGSRTHRSGSRAATTLKEATLKEGERLTGFSLGGGRGSKAYESHRRSKNMSRVVPTIVEIQPSRSSSVRSGSGTKPSEGGRSRARSHSSREPPKGTAHSARAGSHLAGIDELTARLTGTSLKGKGSRR